MKITINEDKKKWWDVEMNAILVCRCYSEKVAEYVKGLLEHDIDFNNKDYIQSVFKNIVCL